MIWVSARSVETKTSNKSLTVSNLKEKSSIVCKVNRISHYAKDNLPSSF